MARKMLVLVWSVFCVLGMTGISQATLIDDTVYMQNYFNSTSYGTETAIVTDDDSDSMPGLLGGYYTVDVNASSLSIDYTSAATWGTGGFIGIAVSDLNDSSGSSLAGVSVTTNLNNWDDNRVWFTDDTVYCDWNGLTHYDTTFLDIAFDFGGETGELSLGGGTDPIDNECVPTPEPATMLLLGTGLAGLAGFRKKFRRT